MSSPRPAGIRLLRPYESEDAFIRGDGLAIGRLGMILMGAPKRAPGVVLRFDIVLASGQVVFRGEGRVIAHRVHSSGRQGLEVRFTRLDAASKAIVEKVLLLRQQGVLSLRSMLPTAAPPLAPPPMPVARTSGVNTVNAAVSDKDSETDELSEGRSEDRADDQSSDDSAQNDRESNARNRVDNAIAHAAQHGLGASPTETSRETSPTASLETQPNTSTKTVAKLTPHEPLDVDAALSTLRERKGNFEPPKSAADFLARLRDRGSRGHQSSG